MAKLKSLDPDTIIKVPRPTIEHVDEVDPLIITVEATEEHDEENVSVIPTFDTTGLDQTDAQKTLSLFKSAFDELAQWELYEKSIIVSTVDDVEQMADARSVRLAVRSIRTNSERIKKSAKEAVLIKGRYIDSIYNSIDSLCRTIENHAEEKELFVARLMEEKRNRVLSERVAKLLELQYNYTHLDLINMPDEVFEQTLNDAKDLYELKQQRIKEAEEQAKLKEDAEKLQKELEAKQLERLRRLNNEGVTTDLKDLSVLSDTEFEDHVKDLIKLKVVEQRKRENINARKVKLAEAGMSLFGQSYRYVGQLSNGETTILLSDVLELSDPKWKRIYENAIHEIEIIKGDEAEMEKRNTEIREIAIKRHSQLSTLEPGTYPDLPLTSLGKMDVERWNEVFEHARIASNAIVIKRNADNETLRLSNLSDNEAVREYLNAVINIPVPTPSSKTLLRTIKTFRDNILSESTRIISTLKDDAI